MYFANFPLIPYDSVGNGEFKLVTNLMKRVALRSKVRTNTMLFDTYDVKEGATPECQSWMGQRFPSSISSSINSVLEVF